MMSTTTTKTIGGEGSIPIKPSPVWQPLKIEGTIPAPYKTARFGLKVTPTHPTFACELEGVDFSKPVSPELYAEIREVCDKVDPLLMGWPARAKEFSMELSLVETLG